MSKHINIRVEGVGAPVLLVNGLIHDLTTWNYYAKVLSKKHKVIRFDFPNQGESHDDEAFLEIEKHSQLMLDVLGRVGVEPSDVTVVAQSSGASAARHADCGRGTRFKNLFLLGINPGGLQRFYAQIYGAYLELLRSSGIRAYYRAIAPMLFSPLFYENDTSILESIITTCERAYEGRQKALETLVLSPFHDQTLQAPPTQFASRTYLVHGHLDYLVPAEKREAYAARCDASRVSAEVFSGGHCFAFEDPSTLVKRVLEVMAGHSEPGVRARFDEPRPRAD
ncbi:MAG: hypothetical protein RL685_70 [Pseudomonadota bacterium]